MANLNLTLLIISNINAQTFLIKKQKLLLPHLRWYNPEGTLSWMDFMSQLPQDDLHNVYVPYTNHMILFKDPVFMAINV